MILDLHVHTVYSWDSIIKLEDLKNILSDEKIVSITDHDTIDAHKKAKKIGVKFIPGEEITTNLGHILAFYVNEDVNKKNEKMDFFEALDKIKEQGAVSCFAHPFDITRKSFIYSKKDFDKALKLVDIIEVYNGKNSAKNDELAFKKAEELSKIKSAGSDSHQLSRVFSAYVELKQFDLDNPKEFLKAMKFSKPKLLKRRDIVEFLNLRIRRLFKGKL